MLHLSLGSYLSSRCREGLLCLRSVTKGCAVVVVAGQHVCESNCQLQFSDKCDCILPLHIHGSELSSETSETIFN